MAALLAAAFMFACIVEREFRAFGLSLVLSLASLGGFGLLLLIDFPYRAELLLGLLGLAGGLVIILLLPLGRRQKLAISGSQEQVDERDAIFHRFYRLEPGTPEYETYYKEHPEKQKFDDAVRALPGLGRPGSKTYDPETSAFQVASFDTFEKISRQIDWGPAALDGQPVQISPEAAALRIKGFARYLGADLTGCTQLNPAYIYSNIGRSPGPWGEAIDLEHGHAVAIAVEMSAEMISQAPNSAATTETAFEYFEVGKIAMILARYINLLGYQARAHVDGNYRVMCVPIAADAGLGELGRIGLLLTPRFGPRIRLAIVTTDLPLQPDRPICFGVQHFCEICKKCASNCPSGSIVKEAKAEFCGVEKWQNRQDTCYRFWRTQGTDCSICISVCPYSHPGSPIHNLARWLVSRNALARKLMLWADDLFYGPRPSPKTRPPKWHA